MKDGLSNKTNNTGQAADMKMSDEWQTPEEIQQVSEKLKKENEMLKKQVLELSKQLSKLTEVIRKQIRNKHA